MRKATFALVVGGVVGLAISPPAGAQAAVPVFAPRVDMPAIQPVWYDRWGRWHPPYRPYGYVPPPYYPYGPRYYPYGPPRPYAYRREQCLRWGRC